MSKVKFPKKAGKCFELPLFGGTMWVFYSREDYSQAFEAMTGTRENFDRNGGIVQVLDSESEGTVMIVGIFYNDLGIVCHEAVHCASFTMDDVGADDEETLAYLTQWCFNAIVKYLPKESEDEAKGV